MPKPWTTGRVVRWVVTFILILFVLVVLFMSAETVGAGERGVKLRFDAVQDQTLDEGLHFVNPFFEKIKKVDVKTQILEVTASSASKDLQSVNTSIAINYNVVPDEAANLYQDTGYERVTLPGVDADNKPRKGFLHDTKILTPVIEESVKAVTAKFNAEELITRRSEVKDQIQTEITSRIAGRHLDITQVSIVNFRFSNEFDAAIEAKQTAVQNALKAENDLKRIETEAQQRIAQSRAEAEAIRIQTESISKQGGAEYVQLKSLEIQLEAIKKWDGKLPQQFVPGSAVPFLNLQGVK